ncbi:MAG: adenylate/guanylate cyclase domain-containing protein [Magnetovibrionaceae bacterium]
MKSLWDFIAGERLPGRLPERAREAVADQQRDSEILIGWLQMAIVIFFAVFYALSPKTGGSLAFQPVPVALALYFAFTLYRLVLAYRGDLAGWFLVVSALLDITLLMGLIWSFHLQYEQPASFYLKAPTLLYVFIFIALRALRFQARYVLLTGAAAVAGWIVLMGYVMLAEAGDPMITRDYISYMTSNAILIGAEVDKIASIIVVTLVVALAITRARRVMVRAVLESAAARDLSRFVSPEIAAKIRESDQAIQAGDHEIKEATVLFTDIEGFSTVSEQLTPTGLAELLNAYFDCLADVINEHDGTINQFQGDALLITYNTTIADPDHALNAVRTAVGIQKALETKVFDGGFQLKTRCGINSGPVVTGAVGTRDRLIYTVHGDDVNVAARLEPLNKTYGSYILASETTVAACPDTLPFKEVGEVTVRGREAPTRIFTLSVSDLDDRNLL